jgi:hypothetical protein
MRNPGSRTTGRTTAPKSNQDPSPSAKIEEERSPPCRPFAVDSTMITVPGDSGRRHHTLPRHRAFGYCAISDRWRYVKPAGTRDLAVTTRRRDLEAASRA